jgi:hypothetical protein
MERLRDSHVCSVPFVDWEVMPPFDGSPDGVFVWFICSTPSDSGSFRVDALTDATNRLRSLAIDAGLPERSATTLRTDVTSHAEIEAGGGRFHFFR